MVEVDDERAGVAKGSGAVALRVPAQAPYVRLARLVGAGMANELGFDVDGLDDVRLAIGEVCALAVHDGAAEINLSYELAGTRLTVSGAAHQSSFAATDADDGQVAFVKQILKVACAAHEVTRDGHGLSFRLTFTGRT